MSKLVPTVAVRARGCKCNQKKGNFKVYGKKQHICIEDDTLFLPKHPKDWEPEENFGIRWYVVIVQCLDCLMHTFHTFNNSWLTASPVGWRRRYDFFWPSGMEDIEKNIGNVSCIRYRGWFRRFAFILVYDWPSKAVLFPSGGSVREIIGQYLLFGKRLWAWKHAYDTRQYAAENDRHRISEIVSQWHDLVRGIQVAIAGIAKHRDACHSPELQTLRQQLMNLLKEQDFPCEISVAEPQAVAPALTDGK